MAEPTPPDPTPPVPDPPPAALSALGRLLAVIARLRAPDGCPWDRAQTSQSLAPHLLEEAHEAFDALRCGDDPAACEELGDVLMNVLLQAQVASERGAFGIAEIAEGNAAKLVRRHPHVFGASRAADPEAAHRNWERIKLLEQAGKPAGSAKGLLAGLPATLPALLLANRIGEKAARVGFDWPDRAAGPRAKLDEEVRELDQAVASGDPQAIAHELGDVLFSVCNLARHLHVEPEAALRGACDRFRARFAGVEQELGPDLSGRTLAELDAAWNRSKQRLADGNPPTIDDGPPTR